MCVCVWAGRIVRLRTETRTLVRSFRTAAPLVNNLDSGLLTGRFRLGHLLGNGKTCAERKLFVRGVCVCVLFVFFGSIASLNAWKRTKLPKKDRLVEGRIVLR